MRRAVVVALLFPLLAACLLLARLGWAQEIRGGNPDNGPWVSSSITVACGTGTITTQTSTVRTKTLGKTVYLEYDILITTIGTCATSMSAPLGFTAAANSVCIGREIAVGGRSVAFSIPSGATGGNFIYYDNTLPNASSNRIIVNCVVEST